MKCILVVNEHEFGIRTSVEKMGFSSFTISIPDVMDRNDERNMVRNVIRDFRRSSQRKKGFSLKRTAKRYLSKSLFSSRLRGFVLVVVTKREQEKITFLNRIPRKLKSLTANISEPFAIIAAHSDDVPRETLASNEWDFVIPIKSLRNGDLSLYLEVFQRGSSELNRIRHLDRLETIRDLLVVAVFLPFIGGWTSGFGEAIGGTVFGSWFAGSILFILLLCLLFYLICEWIDKWNNRKDLS